ncbi:Aste57867_7979 [Aphanomyces stellatus]|uniref:Aste57867_7979 protein n=1 Tax=Aphanomyces stellatus TaxID=120398 RepID=A0A485KJ53_9STRA|nr:hypothetical protein As57867_007949 [Aphanomyces stellatus]VFT84872.1 Aste57867_7979 [Aphanomyces stellatus]
MIKCLLLAALGGSLIGYATMTTRDCPLKKRHSRKDDEEESARELKARLKALELQTRVDSLERVIEDLKAAQQGNTQQKQI